MRILVAEDEAVSRRILESRLRRWGYDVVIACDGAQAWEALQKPDAPDLAILDWEMPGLDGAAVLEEARRRGVDPKRVIISSSHPANELHRAFDASGCLAVIEKAEPEQQAAFMMILDSIMKR